MDVDLTDDRRRGKRSSSEKPLYHSRERLFCKFISYKGRLASPGQLTKLLTFHPHSPRIEGHLIKVSTPTSKITTPPRTPVFCKLAITICHYLQQDRERQHRACDRNGYPAVLHQGRISKDRAPSGGWVGRYEIEYAKPKKKGLLIQ